MPSGGSVFNDQQHQPGYSIPLPEPAGGCIYDLIREKRAVFLTDFVVIGNALLDVTDAYCINDAFLWNSDPALHAPMVPRFLSEPGR
jgi:hypothetical protein